MNWETYIALGDSITIGSRTYLGYPERTGNILETKLKKFWNVVNHAISGITTIELARHIDMHFNTLHGHKASFTTILIGTNDAKKSIAVEDYQIALNQVILKAKLITDNQNVALITIPEFPNGVMFPYNIGMNSLLASYNETIRRLGDTHSIQVLALDISHDEFFDGVHLNDQGILHVAQQIAQHICAERGIAL
jgi:lysophospholipase L1-like esterase